MESIKNKISTDELQELGEEIQEQYNSLTDNLQRNIKRKVLKLGTREFTTNIPINSNEEFTEIISNISILGLDIMKLKVCQRNIICKEQILESEIDCLRVLLSNLKDLRLAMYRELEVQKKSIEVESDVKFNLDEANIEITKYIKKLYEMISEKRVKLAEIRESEVVEIDYNNLYINELLS